NPKHEDVPEITYRAALNPASFVDNLLSNAVSSCVLSLHECKGFVQDAGNISLSMRHCYIISNCKSLGINSIELYVRIKTGFVCHYSALVRCEIAEILFSIH
ncbi:hypothetical protein L9F63_002725, partial [Diploptera punctata]